MHFLSEHNIFIFLVQVLLLLGLSRILGEVFRHWKQPPLAAELLVGISLGPTILGRLMPGLQQTIFPPDILQQNMLETIAWFGVFFLLLETGLEVDFMAAWRQRGAALKLALSDIVVPMIIAFAVSYFLPLKYYGDPDRRLLFSVFMATVMTISAMPIAARVLHDLKVSKTDLGFLIMSALSVHDIIGWLLFTIVIGYVTTVSPDINSVIMVFVTTIFFTIICLTVGRKLTDKAIEKIKQNQLPEPGTSLTFISLLGLACGAVTQKIGIHALFGFFIAGVMSGGARHLSERTCQVISQMVYAIFVPLFFAGIGLKIDFLANFDLFLITILTVVGIAGRYWGALLGVKMTNVPRSNHVAIAIAHTPGGAMEIVVGMLALEYELITVPVFVAIVFSAVISSIIVGPWFNLAISRRKKVSILEFFSHRDVVADVKTVSRDNAILNLCTLAGEHEDLPDNDVIYNAVLERENYMGTALEEGVAVPHARFPNLKRPVVIFGRAPAGIDWNSPDGKPTSFIFLLLTPEKDDVQVQILSLIAKTMTQSNVREELRKAADTNGIWNVLRDAFMQHRIVRK
jgi:Kef-type K+ transport system membrane component KefB/mannitol/fructose-specific phosphotransferase system IIA component